MAILIRQVRLLDNSAADVLIEGNRFARIAGRLDGVEADTVIDGRGKLLTGAFYNLHCHAAMTLLRGLADDLELFPWLSDHIWPAEAKLTPELSYAGSRLAIVEMIKSGVVYFNDMYWHQRQTLRAAEELGVRAAVGELILFNADDPRLDNGEVTGAWRGGEYSSRIEVMLAPHAVYTTTAEQLREAGRRSAEEGLRVHIHLSETAREVADCREAHGMSPVEWIDRAGLLNERAILAHCVHLDDRDIGLIRDSGATVAHMPVSNMKLASGLMPFAALEAAGCRLTLGTDGAASNNSLSFFDEMKFAALGAKIREAAPTVAPAAKIFELATRGGALAAGVDAGVIAEGKVADCLLIDLNHPAMIGSEHWVSLLVYAADTGVVDSVICDGRVLMRERRVVGEAGILEHARAACAEFRRLCQK